MQSPEEYIAQIRAHAEAGRKIEAIKMVRHLTGLGLKDAKELVEHKLDTLQPDNFEKIAPMSESSGCGTKAAAFVITACSLTYYLLANA